MRTIVALTIAALSLLASLHATAAVPSLASLSRQNQIQYKNGILADFPNIIVIGCVGGANGNCTAKRTGATSAYTPSGSKRAFCPFQHVVNANGSAINPSYGNCSVDLGDNSASTPTYVGSGPIQMVGLNDGTSATLATNSVTDGNVPINIENGNKLCFTGTNGFFTLVCWEY